MSPVLTLTELDLVERLASGKHRHDINRALGHTDYHVNLRSACAKLGVADESEAALVHNAFAAGVLDLHQLPEPAPQLTSDQRRILDLIAQGLTAEGMARDTGWAIAFVRLTARTLLNRLGARTPWGAVSRAWHLRILTHHAPTARRAPKLCSRPAPATTGRRCA